MKNKRNLSSQYFVLLPVDVTRNNQLCISSQVWKYCDSRLTDVEVLFESRLFWWHVTYNEFVLY